MVSYQQVRANIFGDLGDAGKAAALEGIRSVLTEENTDYLIERLMLLVRSRLPWYLQWIPLGVILDRLLPEALLNVFEDLLG